jgi:hypothetical protein
MNTELIFMFLYVIRTDFWGTWRPPRAQHHHILEPYFRSENTKFNSGNYCCNLVRIFFSSHLSKILKIKIHRTKMLRTWNLDFHMKKIEIGGV